MTDEEKAADGFDPPESDSDSGMDADAIRASVPIQYPMLMIDRVLSRSPGGCTVIKNLSLSDPCFVGHFPTRAIFPGSMLVESMAQAGFFIGGGEGDPVEASTAKEAFLLSSNVKFLKPAVPGDQITIRTKLIRRTGELMRYRAEAHVGADLLAKGEFQVLLRVRPADEPGRGPQ